MHIEPFALDNGISVNINVTPFNNSKSNKDAFSALTRGLMAMRQSRNIGTEGYFVNLELRPEKQHCQKETPNSFRETIGLWGCGIVFRMYFIFWI